MKRLFSNCRNIAYPAGLQDWFSVVIFVKDGTAEGKMHNTHQHPF